MLAEFVSKLSELAVKAAGPQLMTVDAEPDHVYVLPKADGTVVKHHAEPSPRDHKALSPEALAEYVNSGRGNIGLQGVWYSRAGVVALLSEDRRERITFALALSAQLQTLQGLESKRQPMAQGAFVKLLRIQLHDCLSLCPDFLPSVRSARFAKSDQGVATVGHGKASMGRTVEAAWEGQAATPETVPLSVPIFYNLRVTPQTIACAVDIDPGAETLCLIPLAGEIERAVQAAEAKLGERLAELCGETLLIYGTP